MDILFHKKRQQHRRTFEYSKTKDIQGSILLHEFFHPTSFCGKGHTRLTRWRATLCGMVGESSTSHADDQHPLSKNHCFETLRNLLLWEKSKKSPTIMRIYHQPSTIPLLWTYLLLRQPWWVNTPSASLTDCCCWLRLRASLHGKIIAAYESLKIKGSSSPWLSKQYHLRGRGWRSIQMFHGFPHGFPKMFRQILSQCWENHGQCQTIHGTYGGNIQNYRPKYVSSKIFPRFFATHPNCAPSSILEPLALKRVRMINPSKNSSQWQPCN